MNYIRHIKNLKKSSPIGNKAQSLRLLYKKRFRIPLTYAIAARISPSDGNNSSRLGHKLLREIRTKLNPDQLYAVRSSAEIEDLPDHSFAGQFLTFLNVQGELAILKAIHDVWESAKKVPNSLYYQHSKVKNTRWGMGVIIQEMVNASWSGVAFSKNPVTGRHEVVIEGVKGPGENLVHKGVNPSRWIYRREVLTDPITQDSPGQEVLNEIVKGISKLKKIFRKDVDVEWAWDGKQLYYLQCRPVSTNKYPTIYSNHISREVLPGMIKPLVWSVNIPLVNSAWIRLLEGMLGRLDITPGQLSRSFCYRAYFNMGTLGTLFQKMGMPPDSLENLMGRENPGGKRAFKPSLRTLLYIPRITRFILSNLRLGKRFERRLVYIQQQSEEIRKKLENKLSVHAYQRIFDQLSSVAGEAAYFNIIIPLLMQITDKWFRNNLEKRGDSVDDIDFSEFFPRLKEYNPEYALRHLSGLWKQLPEEVRETISGIHDLENANPESGPGRFYREFTLFLEKYGHFSESGNDFSYPPWYEDPGFVLDMIIQRIDAGSGNMNRFSKKPAYKLSRRMRIILKIAGRYRLYREMISSEYTRCYGLFRILFLKTGEMMTSTGKLSQAKDVFLLTCEEHNSLLVDEDSSGDEDFTRRIDRRKQEIAACEHVILPPVIYGEELPPVIKPNDTVYKGIPVSAGSFEGKVMVVKSYEDFNKKIENAILVIPFSDVGWTPVLTRAGGIVSESGGMLSHASIIARELGIPAIASADHACTIKDGTPAFLDGTNGVLLIKT